MQRGVGCRVFGSVQGVLWHVHVKLAWLPLCGPIGEELECMDINDKGRLCLGDSKGPVGKAAPLEGGGTEVRAHLHGHGLVHGYMYECDAEASHHHSCG